MLEKSDRLKKLPPYLFVEIDRLKNKARSEGRDIIDLGIGDPDLPTPDFIIEELCRASKDPKNHRYALDAGLFEFRAAIAEWYKKRFNVALNADSEILPLIGSKEGIAHFPLAFINPGDVSLIPDPCYPPYKSGTIFAGGEILLMPLLEKNNFLPDLSKIDKSKLKKAKVIYINYPNNPTAACAEEGFYKDIVKFAKSNSLIVVSDAAYTEINFDGYKPKSFLEVDGAKDVGIEFHSLSKTCNMTGWRIGFACGNKALIEGLAKVKSNIDSGIFTAIQRSGVTALKGIDKHLEKVNEIYEKRRDVLVDGLKNIGFEINPPKATFYIWMKAPRKYSSSEFAMFLLEKADIIITPGNGFGEAGEGYVRFALTVSEERLAEAVDRIKKVI